MLTPYSNIKTKEDIIEQLKTNKEFGSSDISRDSLLKKKNR